jgi:hypothetical protein
MGRRRFTTTHGTRIRPLHGGVSRPRVALGKHANVMDWRHRAPHGPDRLVTANRSTALAITHIPRARPSGRSRPRSPQGRILLRLWFSGSDLAVPPAFGRPAKWSRKRHPISLGGESSCHCPRASVGNAIDPEGSCLCAGRMATAFGPICWPAARPSTVRWALYRAGKCSHRFGTAPFRQRVLWNSF